MNGNCSLRSQFCLMRLFKWFLNTVEAVCLWFAPLPYFQRYSFWWGIEMWPMRWQFMTVLLNDEIMEFDVVKDVVGKNITKQSINGFFIYFLLFELWTRLICFHFVCRPFFPEFEHDTSEVSWIFQLQCPFPSSEMKNPEDFFFYIREKCFHIWKIHFW